MNNLARVAVSAAIVGMASSAYADESVTLYGLIDTSLMYVHNSGGKSSQVTMESGNMQGSRWGLKGSEDLGGGLSTIFKLESGFNSTTGKLGQGGRMFGRQAIVGLGSSTWGTVTMGRQYDPLVDLVQPVSGDNYLGGFFTSPGDIDNADDSARINSSVKWASPDYSGLKLEAMYSLGGVAGSPGSGQTYSGALGYTSGSFAVGAGFLHIDNGNSITATRSVTSADSLFQSSVNNAYASARSIDIARVGANYTLNQFILGGYYSYSTYNPDSRSIFVESEKYHNASIYGVWNVTPTLQTELGYNYLRTLGDSSAKYHQVSVAADYHLSKRTDIYVVAAYSHAIGQNGAGQAQAVIGSEDIDAGKPTQELVTIGLRHKF